MYSSSSIPYSIGNGPMHSELQNGDAHMQHTGSHGTAESDEIGTRPLIFKDVPVENHRKMRVVVIGAGFSGIYCGVRIPQRLRNVDLCIYEKNPDLGGTWYENRYPGCACDIPSKLLL